MRLDCMKSSDMKLVTLNCMKSSDIKLVTLYCMELGDIYLVTLDSGKLSDTKLLTVSPKNPNFWIVVSTFEALHQESMKLFMKILQRIKKLTEKTFYLFQSLVWPRCQTEPPEPQAPFFISVYWYCYHVYSYCISSVSVSVSV